jgi:hypothetical protein
VPVRTAPSSVPGLFTLYGSDGKRDSRRRYVTETGEIVSKNQYQKATQGGISKEQFGKLSRSEQQQVKQRGPVFLPPRQTVKPSAVLPKTPTQRTQYAAPPISVDQYAGTDVVKLRNIVSDMRSGKITKGESYKRIKAWFDTYGDDYPDLDESDWY